jgi:hypothetical protein
MAIGSGLAASIGVAAESTYGTYVAPTRFLEFTKEDLKKTKTTIQGGGLAAGRFAKLGSRRVLATVGGTGSIEMDVTNKGFGLLIAHLLGSSATPVQQAATAAYLQTHNLGDNFGKYLTVQKGVPDTGGTVRPYSFLGGKITEATFKCDVMGHLTSDFEFDFKDVSEAQGLAAPSYTAGLSPFHGGQMAVKIGTFGAEASITGVKKVEVKIERSLNTKRYYASSAGFPATKSEPIMDDYISVSGTLETDYVTKADLADRFAADSSTSLIIEWIGPTIASTYKETFRIKVPLIFIDSDTPAVDGPDIVSTGYDFTGQSDGTNSVVTIEYMSTDTTV